MPATAIRTDSMVEIRTRRVPDFLPIEESLIVDAPKRMLPRLAKAMGRTPAAIHQKRARLRRERRSRWAESA